VLVTHDMTLARRCRRVCRIDGGRLLRAEDGTVAACARAALSGGDLLTVFAALVLGVAVMTAVGTLVDRVTLALTGSAAETLGGDLAVRQRGHPARLRR
jgi:hypothetical protein